MYERWVIILMAKNKNKKGKKGKKSISMLQEIDKQLDSTYDGMLEEIESMQYEIAMADQEARKKVKKKLKNKSGYYNMSDERAQARRKVIKSMEGSNLLDRIEQAFKDIVPIIILISRLVASLILAILSLDRIKVSISPQTLAKLNRVYKMAVSIS